MAERIDPQMSSGFTREGFLQAMCDAHGYRFPDCGSSQREMIRRRSTALRVPDRSRTQKGRGSMDRRGSKDGQGSKDVLSTRKTRGSKDGRCSMDVRGSKDDRGVSLPEISTSPDSTPGAHTKLHPFAQCCVGGVPSRATCK